MFAKSGKMLTAFIVSFVMLMGILPLNIGGIFDFRALKTEAAEYKEDFMVEGDSRGYSYDHNILEIKSGGEYTISMASPGITTTTNIIRVTSDEEVTITLDSVLIENGSRSPFGIDAKGDVTIKLKGRSSLKVVGSDDVGTNIRAGLWKKSAENELIITSAEGDGRTSGELTAEATGTNNYGAGIGGEYGESASNITISGGMVTAIATGEYNNGAGIGGGAFGSGSNITISGGTVTAIATATGGDNNGAGIGGGAFGSGSNITIRGGAVTATATGENNYGTGIGGGSRGSGSNIYIWPDIVSSIYAKYAEDGKYITYLGKEDITSLAINSTYFSSGYAGDFNVIGDSSGYSYNNNVLEIKGGGEYIISMASQGITTTTDIIRVTSDEEVTITLDSVLIENGLRSPFGIDAKGDVTIKLKGRSSLKAVGSDDFGTNIRAGLWKSSAENELIITSAEGDGRTSGELTAEATGTNNYGAGIGGGLGGSGSNITIRGGVVTATATGKYNNGAGIGGGSFGSGSNITISGGVVTATATGEDNYGAGIGGGRFGNASEVYISPNEGSALDVKYEETGDETLYVFETDVTGKVGGGYFYSNYGGQVIYDDENVRLEKDENAESNSMFNVIVKTYGGEDQRYLESVIVLVNDTENKNVENHQIMNYKEGENDTIVLPVEIDGTDFSGTAVISALAKTYQNSDAENKGTDTIYYLSNAIEYALGN